MMMDIFNIEYQYQMYLRLVSLTEAGMHPEQRKQLREAFFGAAGQLLILFRDKLSLLDEDDGVEKLEAMIIEVEKYWTSKTKTYFDK